MIYSIVTVLHFASQNYRNGSLQPKKRVKQTSQPVHKNDERVLYVYNLHIKYCFFFHQSTVLFQIFQESDMTGTETI